MTSTHLGTIVAAAVLLQGLASPAAAQSLDYEYFKARVEPIFLTKRPGHVRCYVCHSDRSNNSFKLEKIPAGEKFWSEEQSRRNFEVVSRLVAPGDPEKLASAISHVIRQDHDDIWAAGVANGGLFFFIHKYT